MKNILPLNDPPIYTIPFQTNLLSIISSHTNFWPWLYANFIQLTYPKGQIHDDFSYVSFYHYNLPLNCPLISLQRLSRITFPALQLDLIEFFKKCIDQKLYIFTVLDSGSMSAFKDIHYFRPHNALIYGYDSDEEVFYLKDFMGTYSTFKVKFDEVQEAYLRVDINIKFNHFQYMSLISINSESEFSLDLESLSTVLLEYLHSLNSSKKYTNFTMPLHNFFGLRVYEPLKLYLRNLPQGGVYEDRKSFHALYEHKKLMVDRLEFLTINNFLKYDKSLLDEFTNIRNVAGIIRNKMLKYQISRNESILVEVTNLLDDMEQCEKNTYGRLLKYLAARC